MASGPLLGVWAQAGVLVGASVGMGTLQAGVWVGTVPPLQGPVAGHLLSHPAACRVQVVGLLLLQLQVVWVARGRVMSMAVWRAGTGLCLTPQA